MAGKERTPLTPETSVSSLTMSQGKNVSPVGSIGQDLVPSIESPADTENNSLPSTPQASSSVSPQRGLKSTRSRSPETSDLNSLFGAVSILDTLKEARLSPPNPSGQVFSFGSGDTKETSPFTFRKIYNATPEPSSRDDRDRNSPSASFSTLEVVSPPSAGPSNSNDPFLVSESGIEKSTTRSSTGKADTGLIKYNVRDEVPPNEPYFNPQFQEAMKRGKSITAGIEKTLQECELARDPESQVHTLVQTAKELRSFNAPAVCTIGFVGDSGVGKSSLINSLLDENDLARTAGLGAACTNIVTEYRLRKQEHTAKYTIEIDRMTNEEIDEQIYELLWSYRQFHLCDINDMDSTADEKKQLEEQSKIAYDTLKAAFGNHNSLTDDYLRDNAPGAEDMICMQLKSWTNQLQWPAGAGDGTWLGTAETTQQCISETNRFLTSNLWPFINIIRIYLDSQILRSGAVLADLPGFHDSNHARIKAAETYMYDCDEIFVVAEISRVTTNQNVERILDRSLGKNLRLSRASQGISLICTKSEDLDVEEVKSKFFKKDNRIKFLEQEIESAETDDHLPGALQRRDKAQDELDYRFMSARNDFISSLARDTYSGRLNDKPLSVFCVSNKTYKKHRNRVRKHDLQMQGSGIPALRSYCHKIPAKAQFRVAEHYLSVRIKDFVQRVQLWLAGGSESSLPNIQVVQRLLDDVKDGLETNIVGFIKDSKGKQSSASKKLVVLPMKRNEPRWTITAQRITSEFTGLHHTQVAAFCNNYGSWQSLKVAYREWNLELIEGMVDDLLEWWEDMSQACNQYLEEAKSSTISELDDLISRVKDFHGAPLFAEALSTKVELVRYIFENVDVSFERNLSSIIRDATENHSSSYIYTEMKPTYRQCQADSGTGVTKRRLSLLCRAVGTPSNPTLFRNIRQRLASALSALFNSTTQTLQADVKLVLNQIGADLEMLRGSEAKVLAKNGDFLQTLAVVVESATEGVWMIKDVTELVKEDARRDGYL